MDFSKEMVEDFQTRANLMLAFIARMVAGLMLIVVVLNVTGVFIMPPVAYPVLVVSIMIMFLPTILYNFLHKDSRFWRYFFLTMMVLMAGMMYAIFSYHTVMMLVFPVLLSCLYCNRENVLYVSVLSIPVIVAAHFIAFDLKIVPDEPLVTLYGVIIYGILPRMLEFLSICLVCWSMVGKIHELISRLVEKNNELYLEQASVITSLSEIVEARSKVTGQHVKRVAEYTMVLCKAMGMPEIEAWKISTASMMHDIGKIIIPEEILDKPGKLTLDEFKIIQEHTLYGQQLLENTNGEILKIAAQIAYEHHDRYDGTGYHGLKGEEICLAARCVAIADVFDALMSWRPYKKVWSLEDTRREIVRNSGTQFDPYLVELFDKNFDSFCEIYEKYRETQNDKHTQ